MSELIRVYEHLCPYCDGLAFRGSWNQGGWWETRCARSSCHQFFHSGAYPPNTPARASTIQIRCPNPACARNRGKPGRLFGIGQFVDSFWLEVKCRNCNEFYHYGAYGRGRLALIAPYCVNSLAPELRGAIARASRLDSQSLLSFSPISLVRN